MKSHYLLRQLKTFITTDVMLDDIAYQARVVEYAEYLKSIVYGFNSGLLSPRHVISNSAYGINPKVEIRSQTKIRDAVSKASGVANFTIIRCNPAVAYQLEIEGELIASLLVVPKEFMATIEGSKVSYDGFTSGFVLHVC